MKSSRATLLKKWAVFALALFVLVLGSGCASMESGEQIIVVRSNVDGAQVSGEKVPRALTPSLIEVPRQRHYTLRVKDGKESQDLKLNGKYRWGKSFFSNFMFLTLAPVAWAFDLWTGKAFKYEDEYYVKFARGKEAKRKTRYRIAVAPPRYAAGNFSDQMGRAVAQRMREKYGDQFTVVDYEETLPVFEKYGVDYDKDAIHKRDPSLYKKLGVERIYQSEVRSDGENYTAQGNFQDIFDPDYSEAAAFSVPVSQIDPEDRNKIFSRKNVFFYILPNTVTLDFSSVNTELSVLDESNPGLGEVKYKGQSASADGLAGEISKYLAVLSLRRIDPPLDRKGWRFKLLFSPTINVSYAAEKFNNLPELEGTEFVRSHLDVGYGPSLTYSNRKWVAYANVFVSMAYDKIEGQRTYDNWGAASTSELGLMYFITRSFSARLFTRTISVPQKLWGVSLRDATERPLRVESSQLLTSGLSLGYSLF